MNTFYLEILSPNRTFFSGDCVSIIVPISDGMLGIMAHHTPITAAIENGEITYTLPDGEKRICAVNNGILDVTDNRVRLLCETVCAPDEIDEEKEKAALKESLSELKKQQSKKDYILWKMASNEAINKLKTKHHSEHFDTK